MSKQLSEPKAERESSGMFITVSTAKTEATFTSHDITGVGEGTMWTAINKLIASQKAQRPFQWSL